jgi:hypothetical protein
MSKSNTVKNGKGDKNRIGDKKRFDSNYETIDWRKNKNDNIKK